MYAHDRIARSLMCFAHPRFNGRIDGISGLNLPQPVDLRRLAPHSRNRNLNYCSIGR